jgi:hypothetical protein
MRMHFVVGIILLLVIGGCDNGPAATTKPATQAAATPATQSATKAAQHGDVELFCQNLRPDGSEKNSVSFAGPNDGRIAFSGDGTSSELVWRFVEHRNGADRYEVSRRPKGSPSTAPEVKSVDFSGKPVTVFENASQRISVRPKQAS